MHSPVRRSVRTSLVFLLLLALFASDLSRTTGVRPEPARAAPSPIKRIGEIFEEGVPGGLLDRMLNKLFAEFEPVLGSQEVDPGTGALVFRAGINGARYWMYCNKYEFPNSEHECACDCQDASVNLCDDPGAEPIRKDSRYTVEIYLPPNFVSLIDDPATAHLLVVNSSAPEDESGKPSEGYENKRAVSLALAEQGISSVIWWQEDDFPLPGEDPLPRIAHQLGFPGDGALQRAGFRALMLRDPENLTIEDFRLDLRFMYAQFYVLSTTFFKAVLLEHLFPTHPRILEWVQALGATFAGGSKRGGGVVEGAGGRLVGGGMLAAGIDPRVEAIWVSGFQGFSDLPDSGFHRYETDWRYCSTCDPVCDPCLPLNETEDHPWANIAQWVWDHRDDHPSYLDVFSVARNFERYEDMLILDIVGTHDWINPLGSHTGFWNTVDGSKLFRSPRIYSVGRRQTQLPFKPSKREPVANVRFIRSPNKDHGISYVVGNRDGKDWSARELLLYRALLSLRDPRERLPNLDATRARLAGDTWVVELRAGNFRPDHDPAADEEYTVHVLLSDDRDFRRCSDPIEIANPSVCTDPDFDDNIDEEDKFIPVVPTEVLVVGNRRRLVFPRPAEVDAFQTPPIVAITVEARYLGDDPADFLDDLVLFTEVEFANVEAYPPFDCDEP